MLLQHQTCAVTLLAWLLGAATTPLPLDRHAIVTRHSPSLHRINTSEVAVLGNGAFALSIDVTGLQTLNHTFSGTPNTSSPFRCRCPAHADVAFPLMTGSDWGWHSFKPPSSSTVHSKADPFAPPQPGTFWDRWRVSSNRSQVREGWYPTGSAASPTPGHPTDPDVAAAISWRGANPHRINLGQIALRWIGKRGSDGACTRVSGATEAEVQGAGVCSAPVEAEEVLGVNQTLDLWAGVAHSHFSLRGAPVAVDTVVHGQADVVSANVSSSLVASGELGVAISFGKKSHLSLPHLFCSICWYTGLEDSSMAIVATCAILRKLVHACGCVYRGWQPWKNRDKLDGSGRAHVGGGDGGEHGHVCADQAGTGLRHVRASLA